MVDMHFCGGSLQELSVFQKGDGCEMMKKLPPCHRKMASSCCEDETVIHDADEIQFASATVVDQPAPLLFLYELPVIAEIIPLAVISTETRIAYDPPVPERPCPAELQVFLI